MVACVVLDLVIRVSLRLLYNVMVVSAAAFDFVSLAKRSGY